jgi:hypothetical protein
MYVPLPKRISAFTFKNGTQNIIGIIFSNVQNGAGIIGNFSLNVKISAKNSYI